MTTVFFSHLGCKLNQAELEALARDFHGAGYCVVDRLEEADLHVVNTCTVTHLAARDSRKLARRAARIGAREGRGRRTRTVLTGCYATESQVEAAALRGVDLVVPNDRKGDLLALVQESFGAAPRRAPSEVEISYVPLLFGNTRAALKVEDGCNMRCSFCIIPMTRGRQVSRPADDVARELRSLVATGVKEAVVTGVQISSYRDGSRRLPDLIELLLERTAVERIRLTSIAPWQFDERLFALLGETRLCRHVHLSLQSGCDETLARMRRPYTSAVFADLTARLREEVPGVAVTTDVIVGFPGETSAEFEASLRFVEEQAFARTHAFTYSLREGTAAAGLGDQVPHAIKKQRTAAMRRVGGEAERSFAIAQRGRTVNVLWEDERAGELRGTSDNYLRVMVPAGTARPGELTPVRLGELAADASSPARLHGQLEGEPAAARHDGAALIRLG